MFGNIFLCLQFSRAVVLLKSKLDIVEREKEAFKSKSKHRLGFPYLDELIEKQENPPPRKRIGFKTQTEE